MRVADISHLGFRHLEELRENQPGDRVWFRKFSEIPGLSGLLPLGGVYEYPRSGSFSTACLAGAGLAAQARNSALKVGEVTVDQIYGGIRDVQIRSAISHTSTRWKAFGCAVIPSPR
jgi:hypothetical protein